MTYNPRGYIKIPKRLLFSGEYFALNANEMRLLFYCISLSNSFQKQNFFQSKKEFYEIMQFSYTSLWRCSQKLKSFGIEIVSTKKKILFNMTQFYDLYENDISNVQDFDIAKLKDTINKEEILYKE